MWFRIMSCYTFGVLVSCILVATVSDWLVCNCVYLLYCFWSKNMHRVVCTELDPHVIPLCEQSCLISTVKSNSVPAYVLVASICQRLRHIRSIVRCVLRRTKCCRLVFGASSSRLWWWCYIPYILWVNAMLYMWLFHNISLSYCLVSSNMVHLVATESVLLEYVN
jgi:hypothetical protein